MRPKKCVRDPPLSLRGAPIGASPESIFTGGDYGFRAPSLRSGPGMTARGWRVPALQSRLRLRILRFRFHIHLHLHPELVVGAAGIGAGERHRLAGIARDRDADEIAVADDAVGGIELHPAGARQIDLAPGVGRAAADIVRALAPPIA